MLCTLAFFIYLVTQGLRLIQQQICIFPYFPFATELPNEVLLVLHISFQIRLQPGLAFHNRTVARSDSVSIVLLGDLMLLQLLLCLVFMLEFSQGLIVHPHRFPNPFDLATAAPNFHIPHYFILFCKYQIQQSTFPS